MLVAQFFVCVLLSIVVSAVPSGGVMLTMILAGDNPVGRRERRPYWAGLVIWLVCSVGLYQWATVLFDNIYGWFLAPAICLFFVGYYMNIVGLLIGGIGLPLLTRIFPRRRIQTK